MMIKSKIAIAVLCLTIGMLMGIAPSAAIVLQMGPGARAKTVLDTVANRSLDTTTVNRVADAFVARFPEHDPTPDDMTPPTNAEKGTIFLKAVRQFIIGEVKAAEAEPAAESARQQAEQDVEDNVDLEEGS